LQGGKGTDANGREDEAMSADRRRSDRSRLGVAWKDVADFPRSAMPDAVEHV
jgi:hypothetical protein